MTVSEFLFFAGKSHGIMEKELENRFQTVAKQCSLENLIDKKIKFFTRCPIKFCSQIYHIIV